jgi:hypothetical protein
MLRLLSSLFKADVASTPAQAKPLGTDLRTIDGAGAKTREPKMHMSKRYALLTIAFALITNLSIAQTPTASPMTTAKGTFEVKMHPPSDQVAPSIMTMSIDKQIHGDLEATTKGEMLSAGDPKAGAAGYVAIEQVTGKLAGKTGSFALMHFATMTPGSPNEMKVIVVPGSGSGELSGIYGTFTILIEDGKHSYTFDYGFR